MNDLPVAVAEHDKDIVDSKRYGIYGHEITADDIGSVIFKERPPGL